MYVCWNWLAVGVYVHLSLADQHCQILSHFYMQQLWYNIYLTCWVGEHVILHLERDQIKWWKALGVTWMKLWGACMMVVFGTCATWTNQALMSVHQPQSKPYNITVIYWELVHLWPGIAIWNWCSWPDCGCTKLLEKLELFNGRLCREVHWCCSCKINA